VCNQQNGYSFFEGFESTIRSYLKLDFISPLQFLKRYSNYITIEVINVADVNAAIEF